MVHQNRFSANITQQNNYIMKLYISKSYWYACFGLVTYVESMRADSIGKDGFLQISIQVRKCYIILFNSFLTGYP